MNPQARKNIILALMAFALGQILTSLMVKVWDIDLNNIKGNGYSTIYLLAICNQVFTWLVPGYFLYTAFSNQQERKTHFSAAKMALLIPVTFVLLTSLPVVAFSTMLNQSIELNEFWQSSADRSQQMVEHLIWVDTIVSILATIGLVAILPAIAEELFFRGFLQHWLQKKLANPWIAIILSAAIFSLVHMQLNAFLPRFLLGLLLGYVFHSSKSLLLAMFMHFINNLIPLLILISRKATLDDITHVPNISLSIVAVSGIIFAAALYLYHRENRKNEMSLMS